MKAFLLPDLGEGLHEAQIVAWHVGVGDHVVADQPLVSVETDKAVVEVPSPQAGRIARLCAEPGARLPVGAALVEFEDGTHADTGTVVGELQAATPPPRAAPSGIAASPAVRARARALGVDLSGVASTGPGGTVTMADVEAAAGSQGVEPPAEPLSAVRRAMAAKMSRAGAEVVPATLSDEADIEGWPPDADVTLRLVRAVVAGCRAAPALNAWYDHPRAERRLHTRIDLGIATDTDDGLFVPTLRDVGGRAAGELRRDLDALKSAVVSRRVSPAALRGQTITLSNFGTLGGRHAALVIVPPQVAILGAGRIAARAVAVSGAVAIHRTLPLSLTFDHRAVTGGEAARFLGAAIADLESPA